MNISMYASYIIYIYTILHFKLKKSYNADNQLHYFNCII